MRVLPLFFFFFGLPDPELDSTRDFANVFANAFSTLFHHASCLPHVPSRRHVVSFVITQSLEYLISIAFLDLVVAPRLSFEEQDKQDKVLRSYFAQRGGMRRNGRSRHDGNGREHVVGFDVYM
jgi:hypothetical protein